MTLLKDTWQSLLERRLWPVALLLVGALVAVPMVLAKTPEPTLPPAGGAHVSKDDAMPVAFVSAADAADAATEDGTLKRRRVLGLAKDPFEPAELPKVKKAKKPAKTTDAAPDATATPTPSAPAKGTTGPTPATPPVGVVPTPTPAPTVTVPAYAVKVRFGTTESAETLIESTVERLSVLPDVTNPVLVYRGVEKGGKVAVFELTGDVDAQGDGTCAPTPEDCQYLKLHAGETEFITIKGTGTGTETPDAQYQLDLVKVYKRATKVKAAADATTTQGLAKAAPTALTGKVFALRRRNRYVFDAATGTLHRAAKGARTPPSTF